jgi:hypothetical protein
MIIAMKHETQTTTTSENKQRNFAACAGEPAKTVSLHPRSAALNERENLEMHHTKYEGATIHDIEILCSEHHRAVEPGYKGSSHLKTIFGIDGKRYCETSKFMFEY